MKKSTILASVMLLATFGTIQGQQTNMLDKLSVEVGYGYTLPLTSENTYKSADVAGLKSLHIAANYQINNLWGLRGSYGLNTFTHADLSDFSLTVHQLVAEATFNITEVMNPTISTSTTSPFTVFAHAGAALALGNSKTIDNSAAMGVIKAGVMPMYNTNSNWSVFLDASYNYLLKQNVNYIGLKTTQESSGFLTAQLGIQYRLGK